MKNTTIQSISVLLLLLLSNTYSSEINLLREEIRIEQKNFPKGDLSDTEYVKKIIHKMTITDQKIRNMFPNIWDHPDAIILMNNIDTFNTEKMKKILQHHTWITISKFGKQADNEAWTLVQHAVHDPFFQAGCLFILSIFVNQGETAKSNYAYLYDRVVLGFKMKQKYGTQAIPVNGQMELSPYEGSMEELNQRRHAMGLVNIEEYLEVLRKFHSKQ